ncbi:MAG: V-type ATP synthase subunit D [Actinomycetota bacterium]
MSVTGRAGKVRVERRLRTARHGAALLDRKQRIMAGELDRLHLHSEGVRAEWESAAREAAKWLRRAAALDGTTALEAGAPATPATVEVRWGVAMGVSYPADAVCAVPEGAAPGGSSALAFAVQAHREALKLAVRHAAAERAIALLGAELAATRTRQRAVENRWIPRLEEELAGIRRRLEEQELEEVLRVHWAAEKDERGRGRGREDRGSGPPVDTGVPEEMSSP